MYLGGKPSLDTPVILIMPATNALSLPIRFKKWARVCPRRCCGLHPTLVKPIGQRPKMNDISLSGYPKICADICALECPHRSCGLGSLKKSLIPRGTYATRSFMIRFLYNVTVKPRGFGLKKKRHLMHQ